jgi:integrase/recombinase XerD
MRRALVAMLGLLGLPIFEATSSDVGDLGEEHDHRVLRVCGKGTEVVLVRFRPPSPGPSTGRSAAGRIGLWWRSCLAVPRTRLAAGLGA